MSRCFVIFFIKLAKLSAEVMRLKTLEASAVFLTGALGYWALELLWRGETHWTMPLTGGICFVIIYAIANFMEQPLWQKWIMCASSITAAEFVVGSIVNLRLGWAVWDYTSRTLNLFGQICPMFTFYWLLLSIPGVFLSNILRYYLFIPLYRRGAHSP